MKVFHRDELLQSKLYQISEEKQKDSRIFNSDFQCCSIEKYTSESAMLGLVTVSTWILFPAKLRHSRRILQYCDFSSSFCIKSIKEANLNGKRCFHPITRECDVPEFVTAYPEEVNRCTDNSRLNRQCHLHMEIPM